VKLHYRLGWIALLWLARIVWGFRRTGMDRIPGEGPVIIASNHISNWDPILVGLGCRREVHFMAKEELFRNPFLSALIRAYNAIPVHRGRLDRGALRAGFIACMNGAPVVPAYITGSDRLARAFLRGGGVEVAFGAPISATEAKSSDEYRALSKEIAGEIGRLKQEVDGR
jgi:1-acyl-sn-glycerol-3-phosphate acyltransferase